MKKIMQKTITILTQEATANLEYIQHLMVDKDNLDKDFADEAIKLVVRCKMFCDQFENVLTKIEVEND